ncbi:hypothetical protein GCM10027567_13430 [Spongiibacter taiwanensis]
MHQLPAQSVARTQLQSYRPQSLDAASINACVDRLRGDIAQKRVSGPRVDEWLVILESLLQIVHGTSRRPRGAQTGKGSQTKPTGTSRQSTEKRYRAAVALRGTPPGLENDEPPPAHIRFTHLAKSPDDDSEALEPELILYDEAAATDSENQARTFNQHSHHIRLNRAFAGMSSEAFTDPQARQARQAMKCLLALPALTPEREAAKLLWILTALYGRPFDELAPALIGGSDNEVASAPNGGIISIERQGDAVVVTIKHIIASSLPAAPLHQLASPVQTQFQLRCQLPDDVSLEDGWAFLASADDANIDAKIDQLLAAKDQIRSALRDAVERFTETRLRGSVLQAVFMQEYDLPLTQLLFSERVQGSLAALHYISFSDENLHTRWHRAIQTLYGEVMPAPSIDRISTRVGAPKSGIRPAVFDNAIAEMNRLQKSLRRLSPSNVAEHLGRRAQLACTALGLGAAHRFTFELGQLRSHDLCLTYGLVIFRDKPSDSAVYRRLAVIPSFALAYLFQYLSYLSEVVSGVIHAPSRIKKDAKSALNGARPLFFQVDGDEICDIDPAQWLRSYLPSGIDINQMRHLQSTLLRELSAPPLLVEAHLGHGFQGIVFGDYGLVSPKELATTLRPYLNQFFEDLAIQAPKSVKAPPHLWVSSKKLKALEEAEQESDTKLLLGQIQEEIKGGLLRSRRELITEVFAQHIPGYSPARLPQGTIVTENTALAIRDTLIARTADNLLTSYRVCREARIRLKSHRSDPGCKIALPAATAWDVRPPLSITRANMVAAGQLTALEQSLLDYIARGEPVDRYLIARCALMIWGTCHSFKKTETWLAALAATPLIKGADFQVIEIEGQARTLAGPALLCCLAWLRLGGEASNSEPSRIFGAAISVATLEATVAYARRITLPPLYADIINMARPHAELSRRRLLDLVYNRPADRSVDPILADRPPREFLSRPSAQPKRQTAQFKRLRSFIPKDEESRAPAREQLIDHISTWRRNTEDLSEVTYLLAHWAEIMLGPHANKHTGKTLKRNTVRDYLFEAWSALSVSCENGCILDYESDELTGLLEAALPGNRKTADSHAKAINRLFYEMGQHYDLPSISLKTTGKDSWAGIDAGVITETEYTLIDSILSAWTESGQLHAHIGAGIGQMRVAMQLMREKGARISEVTRLRDSDLAQYGDTQVVLFRPHADRSIKTAAGIRTLVLKEKISLPPNPKRREHLFDYLQSGENERLLLAGLYSAIKFATHDQNGVPHRFRHSSPSEALLALPPETEVIERIRQLTYTSATLGHANVGVTFQYYIHTAHFHIARMISAATAPLDNTVMAALFNETPGYLRKRQQRVREGSSIATQYAYGLQREDIHAQAETPSIPEPPKLLSGRLSLNAGKSIKTTTSWLTACSRGVDPFDAAAGLPLTLSDLQKLAEALTDTQYSLGWQLIDPNRLHKINPQYLQDKSAFQETSALHRYIPPGWLDQQIASIRTEQTDIPRMLLRHLGGLRLRARQHVVIRCSASEQPRLIQEFSNIGFKMKMTGDKKGIKLLPDTQAPEEKLDRNLARFVVLAVLTHDRFSQNSAA